MISDNPCIQQLVGVMAGHGIEDVVVCPGSRNAPIVHTLHQLSQFRCHPLTDERSAGFQAMGMAQATQKPVAVCVTSGSALLNLHPAVAEAYYQHVPLVVISADRPERWIGQQDGQTLPQPGVFGRLAIKSVQLPEIRTEEDLWHANRLVNEALLAATDRQGGPVHINVPIPEPFYEFHTEHLPEVRTIRRRSSFDMSTSILLVPKKILIVIGQQQEELSLPKGYPILSEHLSNAGGLRGNLDTLIAAIPESEIEDYRPDLLITYGGHIVSKQLKLFLRNHPPRQHLHISPTGEVVDTFKCLTDIMAGRGKYLSSLLPTKKEKVYAQRWEALADSLPQPPFSVVGLFLSRLPKHAVLHVANSSAVRLAERYPIRPSVTVLCNRGANGIEGSLSAAVGYATATPEQPNFVLIGDLSFFYDQNALWNTQLPRNLHILLLNNGGGGIFETLPLPEDAESRNLICGRHQTPAEPVCRQHGLRYLCGPKHLADFIQSEESVLLEINE